MSSPGRDGYAKDLGAGQAEATLRLIARLPAPEGLEDRVHAGLRSAPQRGRVLAWPRALNGDWMRAAAAAAIVCVIAGGGWGIYSRVTPGQAGGIAVPRGSGFSEGGAIRRPQTLQGPVVTHPATSGTPKPMKHAESTAGTNRRAGKTSLPAVSPRVE